MPNRAERRAAERLALKEERREKNLAIAIHPASISEPVSDAQLAANRANARLSHGPVSADGKAISSRNHTTHGLTVDLDASAGHFRVLPGENQAAFDQSLAGFVAECRPTTAIEHDLVERLAVHAWLRRRATRLQDEIFTANGGQILPEHLRHFEVLGRYENTHRRAFNKALADLMRYRTFQMRQQKDQALLAQRAAEAKAKEQIRFESQKRQAEQHAVKMVTLHLRQEAQKQRNQRSQRPLNAHQMQPETTIQVLPAAA